VPASPAPPRWPGLGLVGRPRWPSTPRSPTTTDLSKSQLVTILSALDGERRSPANKDAALKAIARSAERLGLTAEAVLQAALGLLDGRLEPAAWRVQLTEPPASPADEPAATKAEGMAKPRTPRSREGTKEALPVDLLRRPEGATVAQVIEATGWQPHTVRGAISGALKKKRGLEVTSAKNEAGERVYRIAAD
jgi:hypothetical protein